MKKVKRQSGDARPVVVMWRADMTYLQQEGYPWSSARGKAKRFATAKNANAYLAERGFMVPKPKDFAFVYVGRRTTNAAECRECGGPLTGRDNEDAHTDRQECVRRLQERTEECHKEMLLLKACMSETIKDLSDAAQYRNHVHLWMRRVTAERIARLLRLFQLTDEAPQ